RRRMMKRQCESSTDRARDDRVADLGSQSKLRTGIRAECAIGPAAPASFAGSPAVDRAQSPAPAASGKAARDAFGPRDLSQLAGREHIRRASVRLHPADSLPFAVRLLRHAPRLWPG